MTKPNDKREWWLDLTTEWVHYSKDEAEANAGHEIVHVVAMADVQPLVEALNYIAETEHCDLVEVAKAVLEKWNGK